jgi:tetratricopeptide (TPR) repeat protein
MPDYSRIARQQMLREAEGYLDLIGQFPGSWKLSPAVRDRLAQRAIDLLAIIALTHKSHFQVSFLTGYAYRLMERYAEAVPQLESAARIDEQELSPWIELGWCYKRLGKLDRAIEALEEAMESHSEEALVHYNLACYWALSKNVPMTVLYLAQAFDIDSSYRDLVAAESDFDAVRHDPHFDALVSKVVV